MMRTLLLTSVLPWPLRRNGGAQRTALLQRALEQFGPVDIFAIGGPALRDEADPDFEERLRAQNVIACLVRSAPRPKPPFYLPGPLGSVWSVKRHHQNAYAADPAIAAEFGRVMAAQKYDLLVSRYLQPALHAGVSRHPQVPKLLDFDDIDWATLDTSLRDKPWPGWSGRVSSRLALKTVRRACDDALKQFKAVFVTSAEDNVLLEDRASVVPNIPYSGRDVRLVELPANDASQAILFIGDLQFPPNRDGLDRFLATVWPAVKRAVPEATLTIVGRGLTDERRLRWAAVPGVNVVGFAPDVVDCYRRCAFSVVPVYTGGGTKIKILESLAFGRTVATTDHALRGYATLAEPEPSVAVATDDAQMIDACVTLLTRPPLRNALARRGRLLVTQEFSFERFSALVSAAVQKVIA